MSNALERSTNKWARDIPARACNKEIIQQVAQELNMDEKKVHGMVSSYLNESANIAQSGDMRPIRLPRIGRFDFNMAYYSKKTAFVANNTKDGTFRTRQRDFISKNKQAVDHDDSTVRKGVEKR